MAIFCHSPPDSSTPFLKLADHLVVAVRQPLDHRIGLAALAARTIRARSSRASIRRSFECIPFASE